MQGLSRWSRRLSAAALAFLLAVVAASIVGRLLFDLTGGALDLLLPGAIEAARYALLVLVFAALPLAAGEGLIRVDFITARLPGPLRGALDRLWLLLTGGVGALMAWNFAEEALITWQRGDATQDLQIPLFLFHGFLTLSAAGFALAAAGHALDPRRGQGQS